MSMEITKAADYGLRAMYRLGQTPKDTSALIGDIATEMQIPAQFLHKVMPRLVKAGLVRSRRGARGGYRLAKDPCEISLLQIVQAIDGPIFLNRCLFDHDDCSRNEDCTIRPVFAKAQDALRRVLDNSKLADVLNGKRPLEPHDLSGPPSAI
ncbi:MAG: Rrf2 family transcriptional regulator [Polyangia bacterium]|jgi:Rrf2 family protein|nr:Rrf2 family transcriptional regulator [Polyangia bacterium]